MNILLLKIVGGSYLLGSIPTGYWLGKAWKGIDIRTQGSGNVGATNVVRVLGVGPGVITFLIDCLKGALPVLWVQHTYPGALGWATCAGLAAILGHTTSPFVRFQGGKGVATSGGAFAALLPIPTGIGFAVFLVCLAFSRMVSASSILAAVALAVSAFKFAPDPMLAYAVTGVSLVVIWKHRDNIKRILAGTESRI